MRDLPTIVAGIGRCGSSMLMQMLIRGGLKPTGDAELPFLEDSRSTKLPKDPDWLMGLDSTHAVKILSPDTRPPPVWFRCNAIWLSRGIEEQIKSYVKYHNVRFNEQDIDHFEVRKNIERKVPLCLRVLNEIAEGNYLSMSFESILVDPLKASRNIKEYLRLDLDVYEMVEAVVPRSPGCLVDMPEIQFLADKARYEQEKLG